MIWTELKKSAATQVLDDLFRRAEEQNNGLSTADILDIWPEASDDLETVIEFLEEKGIEIDHGIKESGLNVPANTADFEGIDSDDSVSLYFREVGSVPLLDPQKKEVALAKRIERGRLCEEQEVLADERDRAELARARTPPHAAS